MLPATLERKPGVRTYVSGTTAMSHDFNALMRARAPWVFAFVLSLAFLLLLLTFRSLVIALTAVVLNLLSVGAAYGILVWIFQDGNLESVLGFNSIGGITSWLPLFLFVILFGLSMDYHVFILSRIREGHDRGMSTEQAVAHGIASTASVVTSAAIVMVAVFGIFAALRMLEFKQMGVGLALAVLIDATIIRAVLLPATMKLLGDWNWYLPRWLEWLAQPWSTRRRRRWSRRRSRSRCRAAARARTAVADADAACATVPTSPAPTCGAWLPGVDDHRPRQPILQAAAPVVVEDEEEAGEERDRGERQPDEPQQRAARAQSVTRRRQDPDAHDAAAGRLTRGGPEGHEVTDAPEEVQRAARRHRDRTQLVGDGHDGEDQRGHGGGEDRDHVDERGVERERDRARDQADVGPRLDGLQHDGIARGDGGRDARRLGHPGRVRREAHGGSWPGGAGRCSIRRAARSSQASARRDRSPTSPAIWSAKPAPC